MSTIHWLSDVSGDFSYAADWKGGAVPGPSDSAVLDATGSPFTVTSYANEAVKSLVLAANATLDIGYGTVTASSGTGRGVNAGTINVGRADNSELTGPALEVGGTLSNVGGITLQPTHGRHGGAVLLAADTMLKGGESHGFDRIREFHVL